MRSRVEFIGCAARGEATNGTLVIPNAPTDVGATPTGKRGCLLARYPRLRFATEGGTNAAAGLQGTPACVVPPAWVKRGQGTPYQGGIGVFATEGGTNPAGVVPRWCQPALAKRRVHPYWVSLMCLSPPLGAQRERGILTYWNPCFLRLYRQASVKLVRGPYQE